MVQSVHQAEAQQVLRWWKNLGLADELRLARDQPIKWYMWIMNILPDPKFREYRIEIVKLISLLYILDDIYDVYGTLDELILLTHAVDQWELSAVNSLPDYMRKCYEALFNITNEVAQVVLKQYGHNPINSFKNMWTSLCNAFLQEARWYSSGHIPNTDQYLENSVISSGVHIVLVPIFFLLGEHKTTENLELIESKSSIITHCSTILRLWDDLGSAKDENQQGYDGSYVDCYKKEHPKSSTKAAMDCTMQMISKAWEGLNKELIKSSSLSSEFLDACLNIARMVRVMYTYSGNQTLPLLKDYTKTLLSKKL